MRSADESDTSKVVKSEGRSENKQGEALSLHSDPEISVQAPSIANLTTALITSAIPLTVLQNGLSLSTPLMVPQSTFQNTNPLLLEFKGQGGQILPNDLGIRLVTDSNFKPPVVIGLPASVGPVTMPIKRETSDNEFTDSDDSSSNQEWTPSGGSGVHSDESAVDYSVTAPSYNSAAVGTKTGAKKMKTSTGSRRNCKDVKPLSQEEEERRKLRRERNKLAAAKCRQKRVDQTNQLLAETQVLEEEQSRLEEEIKKFQQQKEELEFILEAHRLHCGLGKQPQQQQQQPAIAPAQNPPPAAPSQPESLLAIKTEGLDKTTDELKPQVVTTQGPPQVMSFMQRPTSFPMASRSLAASNLSAMNQALGIPISTPLGGIVITLDSMLDGHTGLTPITGVPSIVAQTPQNPTNDLTQPTSDALTPASNALMSL